MGLGAFMDYLGPGGAVLQWGCGVWCAWLGLPEGLSWPLGMLDVRRWGGVSCGVYTSSKSIEKASPVYRPIHVLPHLNPPMPFVGWVGWAFSLVTVVFSLILSFFVLLKKNF